jgi:hypothetical protein
MRLLHASGDVYSIQHYVIHIVVNCVKSVTFSKYSGFSNHFTLKPGNASNARSHEQLMSPQRGNKRSDML